MEARDAYDASEKDLLMPSGCKDGIDLVHLDKGKIVGMGNYSKGKLALKREDMACLIAKTPDHPLLNLSINVLNKNNEIDYFSVDHHGLPVQTLPGSMERWFRMPFLAYTLAGQKGVRFDLGFSGNARCSYDDASADVPYKVPVVDRDGNLSYKFATRQVIDCIGEPREGEAFHTTDKIDEKKRVEGMEKSILADFLDADKFKKNKMDISLPSGGSMTFTPFYFTEQWWMIRGGAQLKEKTAFPLYDADGRERKRKNGGGLISKIERLDREVDFLYGDGERSTLVDIASSNGIINGDSIGQDPNTYVINKAFVDPIAIESVSFDAPRNYKAKSATVTFKPGTECQVRSNFKRRPSTIKDDIMFCTNLQGMETTYHDRARKIQADFLEQLQRQKAEKSTYKQNAKKVARESRSKERKENKKPKKEKIQEI